MAACRSHLTGSIVCFGWAVFFTLASSSARANMYQYTDKNGTVCMTNSLDSVPRAERKSVKIISEDPKPKPPGPVVTDRGNTVTPAQADVQAIIADKKPHPPTPVGTSIPVKPIGVAVGVIGFLFVVARLTRSLSSPQLAKVIYIAFFLGTFTLGYKLYADHLANGFVGIKQKMITMFAKAQQREGLIAPQPKPDKELDP
jgi:hypothetical protein